jgi:hypothetical protein
LGKDAIPVLLRQPQYDKAGIVGWWISMNVTKALIECNQDPVLSTADLGNFSSPMPEMFLVKTVSAEKPCSVNKTAALCGRLSSTLNFIVIED